MEEDAAKEEEKRQREAAKAARGGRGGARGSGRMSRWGVTGNKDRREGMFIKPTLHEISLDYESALACHHRRS